VRAAGTTSKRKPQARSSAPVLFFAFFLAIQFAAHAPHLSLPFFWDELGQFVPSALDILRLNAWVPVNATPNVHPPLVMGYLAAVWKVTGYSILVTRLAMLVLSAGLLLATFLLAVEVYRRLTIPLRGAPAFVAVLLLAISPLFFAQSLLAQLDMPAALFSILALWLFLKDRHALCALTCAALVLTKETGVVFPGIFFLYAAWQRRWREALLYSLSVIPLAGWLLYLRAKTGSLVGDRSFEQYNIWYQLHPVRLPLTLLRRVFYLFIDQWHLIGTLMLAWTVRKTKLFASPVWRLLGVVFLAHVVLVSVLGGAALERYLLPVLPILYIGIAAAWAAAPRRWATPALLVLLVGLASGNLINPRWPFPYENNLAFVDFVRLHQEAATYLEVRYPRAKVASTWPFVDSLRRTEFGYVQRPIRAIGIEDFRRVSLQPLRAQDPDVFVHYSRIWDPRPGLLDVPGVGALLSRYYAYEPVLEAAEIQRELGLVPVMRMERGGQWIEIYARPTSSSPGPPSVTL
jgi:4-amino-4-deoxy-L-arabinose transferase-like glycosyltransferase